MLRLAIFQAISSLNTLYEPIIKVLNNKNNTSSNKTKPSISAIGFSFFMSLYPRMIFLCSLSL